MRSTFRALRNPNYRRYWSAGVVSNVGIWMQRVAQDWLVLQMTGSATALGVAMGLQMLPTLLLSPIAGVIVDSFPKRRLLQLTTFLLAAVSGTTGALAVAGLAQPWHVYVLILAFGVVAAFEAPTRQAFVPQIVDRADLVNAVGLNSVSFNIARLLGPALSGVSIAALGSDASAAGWVILMTAGSYLVVIVALSGVHTIGPEREARRGPDRRRVREGVRYVRRRPDLMMVLVIVLACGAFGLNFNLSSALMSTQVFGKGAGEFGALSSALAIGSLAGALLAARRTHADARFVARAAAAFGVSLIVAGTMPTYLGYALWAPVVGLLALTVLTAANATMQLRATDEYRGRVMSLYLTLLLGGAPVGSPLLGYVGDTLGARWVQIGGGGIILLTVLVAGAAFGRADEQTP